jgi:hypothetical protein
MEATGCRVITYGKEDAEFSIYDVADLHLMNRGVAKSKLKADIDKIRKDPYSMFAIGGDYADWIFPGDPRFDYESLDEDLKAIDLAKFAALVSKMVIRTFQPIAGKCLGICVGNHEQKTLNRASLMNIHEDICKGIGAPNMRYSGWFDLYFVYHQGLKGVLIKTTNTPPKRFTAKVRVFIHHGMGAANTAGGKINKLKALVDMVNADLVMMGHVHEQFAKAFLRLSPNENCTEINQKVTMGLITGSYLLTYPSGFTGYGEIKAYSPATLGATRAIYSPKNMSLTVENRADNVGQKGTV